MMLKDKVAVIYGAGDAILSGGWNVIESVLSNPSNFRREIHVETKRCYVLFLLLVSLGATGMKAQEA